jgi:hypothetical protein
VTDIKQRIEELEKTASEKELLALLATNPKDRIQIAQVARGLRLAALRLITRRTSSQPTE